MTRGRVFYILVMNTQRRLNNDLSFTLPSLDKIIHQLQPGERLCYLYQSPSEHQAIIAPYIRYGLENGEACLYITQEHTVAEVETLLASSDFPLTHYLQSGQLMIVRAAAAYQHEGHFTPAARLQYLTDQTEKALQRGFRALRLLDDMSWSLYEPLDSRQIIAHEAHLDALTHILPVVAICQYNDSLFPPEILLDTLVIHSLIIVGGAVCHNLYYIPPDKFLQSLHDPQKEYQYYLNHLRSSAQLHHALQSTERRYQELFNNLPIGLYQITREGEILNVNQTLVELLRYPNAETLLQSNIRSLYVNTKDQNYLWEKMWLDDPVTDFVTQIRRYDGTIIWARQNIRTIASTTEHPVVYEGILEDITDRRQAEETLHKLLRAVEQTDDSVVITNRKGIIEYINPAFERLTGYSVNEALGQTPRLLKSGVHDERFYQQLWTAILRGDTFWAEFTNRKKSGELYYQEETVTPIRNSHGEITHFVSTGRDITERKRQELERAQLYEAERQQRQHAEALHAAGVSVSSTLDMQEVLERILNELGKVIAYDSASVLLPEGDSVWIAAARGLPLKSLFAHQLFRANALLIDMKENHQPLILEDASADPRFEQLSSTYYIRGWMGVPLLARDRLIGYLTLDSRTPGTYSIQHANLAMGFAVQAAMAVENARLHQDLQKQIQVLQEAQVRLIQSEKLAAIGELIAGVAHELNNPLGTVILYAQLLQRKIGDAAQQKDLSILVQQAQRAAGIVRALLDFARQRPPERMPIQLNDIIASALSLMAYELRTHNIQYRTELTNDLPLTLADSHQLQQVFINLLNNAYQAISSVRPQGTLTISTELGPSLFLRQQRHSPLMLRARLADDGPGISPEALNRVFDPFFTTKPPGEGTGLGLSVCHGIINEHAGHIWAESQLGQGTTFFVEIPWIRTKPDDDESVAENNGRPAATISGTILIIDDETGLRQVIARALRQEQYQVDTVDDGQAGWQKLQTNDYDLILCDVRMPGLSGPEFYWRIQAEKPHLLNRLFFITGDTVSQSTQQFLQAQKVPYLVKPFELDVLGQAVQKHIAAAVRSTISDH